MAKDIDKIVGKVLTALKEMGLDIKDDEMAKEESETEDIIDILSQSEKSKVYGGNIVNIEYVSRMKEITSARIGVGMAGPRLKTTAMLALRADHAFAIDSVFEDVSEDLLNRMGMKTFVTKCSNRSEFLTRPDLGREFEDSSKEQVKLLFEKKYTVVIYASDGLSSKAIEANIENVVLSVKEGLKMKNISCSEPFFVKYGRVPAMDVISELSESDISCVFIGERPGLGSSESMSCYITYKGTVGMPESRRTVISNIHSGGIAAVEAGAYIAELIEIMLEQKASGVELRK